MKKAIVVILMLGLIITLIGNSVGMGQKTLRTPQTNVSTTTIVDTEQELEKYVPKIIIKAKWGTKPGEFGIPPKGTREAFWGPSAITIDDDGNIYMMDRWNKRVQIFDKNGNFKREIKLIINLPENIKASFFLGKNLAVDKKRNIFFIFMFENKSGTTLDERIQKYSYLGKLLKEWNLKTDLGCINSSLEITPWSEVYLKCGIGESKAYKFISFEDGKIEYVGKGDIGLKGNMYIPSKLYGDWNETSLTIVDKKGNTRKIEIPLIGENAKKYKDYKLVWVDCLNIDKFGHVYTESWLRLRKKDVEFCSLIISKLSQESKIISQIDFLVDNIGTNNLLIDIDRQGNIYEVSWPKETGVKITRWEMEK